MSVELISDPFPPVALAAGGTGTDEALLLAVARGDRQALAALQGRVAGLVRVNVRRLLRDASRAEAVTQSIFAELLEEAARFDPRQESAQSWLMACAHRRAMDNQRAAGTS